MRAINDPRFPNRKISFGICVAVALSLASYGTPKANAFAAPGGYSNGAPFSNGSFFPTDGTFQATIRGKNLSGVAVFSTSADGDNAGAGSSSGSFSVVFNDATYVGNVYGSIDTVAGQIAATLEASVDRSGNGQLITTLQINQQVLTDTTNEFEPVFITITDPDGTVTEIPDGTVLTNTETTQSLLETELTATSDYNDVLYVSGSFLANLYNSYPNQGFTGKGKMTFQELQITFSETNSSALAIPSLETTTVNIKVDGARTSNSSQTFTPFTVEVPYVVTTYQVETTTVN